MRKITVTSSPMDIVITIPVELLVFASEEKPDLKHEQFKVIDAAAFSEAVARQIDGEYYDQETGLSKFETFIDEVVEQVIESGDESVSIADW